MPFFHMQMGTLSGKQVLPFLAHFFFPETVESFEIIIHMKVYGSTGTKIGTNEFGHMTKMAAMPIYGKNLYKVSFQEPIGWWPWN